ncbi:hypothetical protein G8764_22135 [Pseudomaricurvus alcaniphilus]|uniref:hypothetical protein n=1 Tax=Pseudomaricurvus alcaniphilus TaxID=1166482 RepID=UPI001409E384|nr:hypothetical protein [Pseudomaricurvus alcaniphilus]NHN40006.1 hypothetical protein [Pseudomaricurvus alcaniphilus]
MSMNITRLTTYWTADEADAVISLLDELRDSLWTTYGEQIIELRRNAKAGGESDNNQADLPFDDNIDF